jgi:hypothetical protein
VIDGEIVAHGEDGLPSFNVRPNHRGGGPEPNFYSFDLLTLRGRDPSSCARRSILLDAFALPGRRDEVRTMLVEIYTPVRFLRLMIVWTQ